MISVFSVPLIPYITNLLITDNMISVFCVCVTCVPGGKNSFTHIHCAESGNGTGVGRRLFSRVGRPILCRL